VGSYVVLTLSVILRRTILRFRCPRPVTRGLEKTSALPVKCSEDLIAIRHTDIEHFNVDLSTAERPASSVSMQQLCRSFYREQLGGKTKNRVMCVGVRYYKMNLERSACVD
jgi:hypothetical protein